jgi:cyclophilin family peptidyl-prolyl cis-trans isomerase
MWLSRASFVLLLGIGCASLACSDDKKSSSSGNGGDGGSGATGGGGANGGSGGDTGGGGSGGSSAKPIIDIETSMGTMSIELEPDLMPITTANFLTYVDEGFFPGTLIHRVIPDFVIQGGGYTTGLAPKNPTHAPIVLETNPAIVHDYGAISMARTDQPNTATTQFFVVNAQAGAHSLDGQYAAFGHMLSGSEVLDAISAVATGTQGQFMDVPNQEITIVSVTQH